MTEAVNQVTYFLNRKTVNNRSSLTSVVSNYIGFSCFFALLGCQRKKIKPLTGKF